MCYVVCMGDTSESDGGYVDLCMFATILMSAGFCGYRLQFLTGGGYVALCNVAHDSQLLWSIHGLQFLRQLVLGLKYSLSQNRVIRISVPCQYTSIHLAKPAHRNSFDLGFISSPALPDMYTQTILFLNHSPYNPSIIQHNKSMFSPNLKSGFCCSSQRVSNSRIISRNGACLAVSRRGLSHINQELNQEENRDHGYYMRRCVEVARKAIGCTSPNPMVGCVIVRDGKIVGEGFHPKAGQSHAEVFALRDAGDFAENGIAYVSLEPCNHYGRTPPCTEALIKAKVKKVVIGMMDPNPIVATAGVKRLQDAGIEVIVGVEEKLCKRLNEAYIHQMLTGEPFVTLRYSMSLGGNLLDQIGDHAMERGEYYSKLLQEYDVVILSSTSIANKSMFPVPRELGANQPLIIVLSSTNSLIQIPDLTSDAASKVMIISEKELKELENGQERVQSTMSDRISLAEILGHCKRKGLCSVLLDLMGDDADFKDILKEGFDNDLFQKVIVEVLPIWGGSAVETLSFANMKAKVENLTSIISNESVIIEGYFC